MSRASRVEVRVLVAAAALVLALVAVIGPHAAAARATNLPTQVTDPTSTDTTPTTQPTTTQAPTTLPPTTAAPTTTLAPPPTRPHPTTTTPRASTTTTTAPTTTSTLATTSTSVEPSSSVTAPALSNPATSTTTKPKATSSGGLSDSAKLSIVVVGLLAVGAAILVLTYLYWRRTRPAGVAAVSPSALDALVGLDVDGPPTAPVPVIPAAPGTTAAAAVGAGAVVGASKLSSAPDSGLHALVPPIAPPVAPTGAPASAQPVAVDSAAGLGGVTPDPQAGVRILGPAVGLSAALASAAADRDQGHASPLDPAPSTPIPGEADPPEPVVVLAGSPEDESEQIARELWPSRDEPVVSDDGDGLADLWRAPLKIVTLEDLQQGGSGSTPEPNGAVDGTDVIDLGDDHG